jgi:hypothetical protein
MPAPYRIVDATDGLFDLARADGVEPTAVELDLAKRIRRLLDSARDFLDRNQSLPAGAEPIKLPAKFIEQLRAIAASGLSAPIRDVQVAEIALRRIDGMLRGPFLVGQLGLEDMVELRRNLAMPDMTDDQRLFMTELEGHERLILSLYRDEPNAKRRREIMQRLRWAAMIGLMDTPPDVRLARFAVAGALLDAMRERGPAARVAYLNRLALSYATRLFQFGLALLAFWALRFLPAELTPPPALVVPAPKLVMLCVVLASVFMGAWLSAAFRLQPDSREVLDGIYTNTFTAPLRASFVLGFSLLAIVLLYKGVVAVSFGTVSGQAGAVLQSGQLLDKLSAAVLIGGLLGLGEALLPNAMIQRSTTFMNSLLGAATPPAQPATPRT